MSPSVNQSGIYSITHVSSGRQYIGSASNIKFRWSTHLYDLNHNKHHSKYLQRLWNKYGKQEFIFDVVELCEKNILLEREQYFIDTLKPVLNLLKIAALGPVGYKWSDEARQKMSEQRKGHKGYWEGKSFSNEHLTKISEAGKGRKFSEEHKANLSKANKGHVMSEEQKEKLKLAWVERKKRGFSDETRRKMSESAKQRIANKKQLKSSSV